MPGGPPLPPNAMSSRPVAQKLWDVPEYRERYLAKIREIAEGSANPDALLVRANERTAGGDRALGGTGEALDVHDRSVSRGIDRKHPDRNRRSADAGHPSSSAISDSGP